MNALYVSRRRLQNMILWLWNPLIKKMISENYEDENGIEFTDTVWSMIIHIILMVETTI